MTVYQCHCGEWHDTATHGAPCPAPILADGSSDYSNPWFNAPPELRPIKDLHPSALLDALLCRVKSLGNPALKPCTEHQHMDHRLVYTEVLRRLEVATPEKCLGLRTQGGHCQKPRITGRVFCADHAKENRFAFLSGYSMRNDEEEAEVLRLKDELESIGLGDHGWPIVDREVLGAKDDGPRK